MIILRMQGLPWSATAKDIRQHFEGLSIPDGGVHIIGGEDGDVFIAFSTDEDARKAMQRQKQPLCGSRIMLMLSSKAEMQEVIAENRAAPPPVRKIDPFGSAAVIPSTAQTATPGNHSREGSIASSTSQGYNDQLRGQRGYPEEAPTMSSQSYPPPEYSTPYFGNQGNQGFGRGGEGIRQENRDFGRDKQDMGRMTEGLGRSDNQGFGRDSQSSGPLRQAFAQDLRRFETAERDFRPDRQDPEGYRQDTQGYRQDIQGAGRDNKVLAQDNQGIRHASREAARDFQGFSHDGQGLRRTDDANRVGQQSGRGIQDLSYDNSSFGGGNRSFGADNQSHGPDNQAPGQVNPGLGTVKQGRVLDNQAFGQNIHTFGTEVPDRRMDNRAYRQDTQSFGPDSRNFGRDNQDFGRDKQGSGPENQVFGRDDQGQGFGQGNQSFRKGDQALELERQRFGRDAQAFKGREYRGDSTNLDSTGGGDASLFMQPQSANRFSGKEMQPSLIRDDRYPFGNEPHYGRPEELKKQDSSIQQPDNFGNPQDAWHREHGGPLIQRNEPRRTLLPSTGLLERNPESDDVMDEISTSYPPPPDPSKGSGAPQFSDADQRTMGMFQRRSEFDQSSQGVPKDPNIMKHDGTIKENTRGRFRNPQFGDATWVAENVSNMPSRLGAGQEYSDLRPGVEKVGESSESFREESRRPSLLPGKGAEERHFRSPFGLEGESGPGDSDINLPDTYPVYHDQSTSRSSDFDNRSNPPQFPVQKTDVKSSGVPSLLRTDAPVETLNKEQQASEENATFYAVQVSGLPYSCTEKDIEDFFRGVNIAPNGIQLHLDRRGKPLGTANIKLGGQFDVEDALSRHRKYLGRRYVDVAVCTLSNWERGIKDGRPPAKKERSKSPAKRKKSPIRGSNTCIEVKGLSPSMREVDVKNFFEGLSINSIFFENTKDSTAVYVDFANSVCASKACQRNGCRMGRRTISVRIISREIVEAKKNNEVKRKSERRSPGKRSPERRRGSSPKKEQSPTRRGRSPSYRSSSRSSPGRNGPGRRGASPSRTSNKDRESSRTRSRGSSPPAKRNSQDRKDSLLEKRERKESQPRVSPLNRTSRNEDKKDVQSPNRKIDESVKSDITKDGKPRSLLADPPAKERIPSNSLDSKSQDQQKTNERDHYRRSGGDSLDQIRTPVGEQLDDRTNLRRDDGRGDKTSLQREEMSSRRDGHSSLMDKTQKWDQREEDRRPGLLDERPGLLDERPGLLDRRTDAPLLDTRPNPMHDRHDVMDMPQESRWERSGREREIGAPFERATPLMEEDVRMGPRENTRVGGIDYRERGPWDRPPEEAMDDNQRGQFDRHGPMPDRWDGPQDDRHGRGMWQDRRSDSRHGDPSYDQPRGPPSGRLDSFRDDGQDHHMREEDQFHERHNRMPGSIRGPPNDRKQGPMERWHGDHGEDRPPMEPFGKRRGLLEDPEHNPGFVPEKRGRFDPQGAAPGHELGHQPFSSRDRSPGNRHMDEGPQNRGRFAKRDFIMHGPGENRDRDENRFIPENRGARPGSMQEEVERVEGDRHRWPENLEHGARKEDMMEHQATRDKEYCCAHVRNVPFQARWPEIAQFFHGLKIVPGGIHIMLGPDGRTSGHCFIEFSDSHEAQRSEERRFQHMRDRPVQINACSKSMMIRSIEQGGELKQSSVNPRHLNQPHHGPRQPFGPRGPHGPGFRGDAPGFFPGPRGPSFGPRGPRPDVPFRPPFGDRQRGDEVQPPPQNESRPRMIPEPEEDKPPVSKQPEAPENPSKSETKKKEPDAQNVEESKTPSKEESKVAPVIKKESSSTKSTGSKGHSDVSKGSVVCATNLPLTITVDAIREFLKGFDIVPGAVKLDTHEMTGKATGQAKIVFSSPAEANRAIKERNNRPLNGRIVRLHVV